MERDSVVCKYARCVSWVLLTCIWNGLENIYNMAMMAACGTTNRDYVGGLACLCDDDIVDVSLR